MPTERSTGSKRYRESPAERTGPDGGDDVEYRQSYVDRITLSRALVAGVLGGIAFGIPLQFLIGRMAAIGALYTFGDASITVGWVAHLGHSALFGLIFGLITEYDPLHGWMERGLPTAGLLGVAFAVGLYAVNIAVVWPTWLSAVGFPPAAAWSVPHTPARPFLGHLLWGAITGTVFHSLVDY